MLIKYYVIAVLVIVSPVSLQSSSKESDKDNTSIELSEDDSSEEDTEEVEDRDGESEEMGNSIPLDSIPEEFLRSTEHWALSKEERISSHEDNKLSIEENTENDSKSNNKRRTELEIPYEGDFKKKSKHKKKKSRKSMKVKNEQPTSIATEQPKAALKLMIRTNKAKDEKAKEIIAKVDVINFKAQRNMTKVDKDIPKIKYPYVVSVQKKTAHYASGALVTLRWVISSAREFYNVRESIRQFRVRYGTVNCKRGPTVPIKSITLHPGFDRAPNYDVSLLKMAADIVQTNSVKPIPLALGGAGDVFLTTYWARLIVNNTVLPRNAKERFKSHSLRVSKQSQLPWNGCSEDLKREGVTLTNNSFCMKAVVDHHTECLADPGAPVVVNGFLYGVTSSWSPSYCHQRPYVTVAAAVTQGLIRDWINGTVS